MRSLLNRKYTYGQVLYALCRGVVPPSRQTQDQIRYLRELGVPYDAQKKPLGRGNQVWYSFEDLVELGVGLFALGRGMKPRDVAHYLVSQRRTLRKLYRQALEEQPEAALDADWVKSRGRVIPGFAEDILLRLHDRYRDEPGKIEPIRFDELEQLKAVPGDAVERYPGQEPRTLIPLTRLVIELAAWAREAPLTRPGRKA